MRQVGISCHLVYKEDMFYLFPSETYVYVIKTDTQMALKLKTGGMLLILEF